MSDGDQILRSLGRVEGKIDQIVSNQSRIERDQVKLHTNITNNKEDINKVKFRQNYHSGGLAALFAILVFFKDAIAKALF